MQPLTYVLKTLEKQALNGSPLVTLQCVPALDMKKLLRRVPRPPTLTYVLLTYDLAMPDCGTLRHIVRSIKFLDISWMDSSPELSALQAQIYTCRFVLVGSLFFGMLAVTVTVFNFEPSGLLLVCCSDFLLGTLTSKPKPASFH